MVSIQNIYSNAFSLYQDMGNSNYLRLVVPNMHQFSQFWMFCKLHGILDKINKEKYDLPVQRKSLYLALFANVAHQSMHQVLQGTLTIVLQIDYQFYFRKC